MKKETNPIAGLLGAMLSKRREEKRVRIGLAGDGPMMMAMARAYEGQPLAESIALYCPARKQSSKKTGGTKTANDSGDLAEFISAVDAVEIFDIPGGGRSELALELLRAGKHVSLQKPFASTLEEADELIAASRASGASLRANEPALFHEPYLKLKKLITEMEIGEICAVRIHANLCGKGGWGSWPELLKGNFLPHPAFDNFALAAWLAGEIESVCAYTGPMSPMKGGRALIGLKFKAPGCYGHLDLTYAPQTTIRSNGIPCDDTIEVAGTDGIIWARHFHGKMTEEPWIEVRRGKKHYTLGIGSGMALEWEDSLRASAAHFLKKISRGAAPGLSADSARSALKALLAAKEASETNSEIVV